MGEIMDALNRMSKTKICSNCRTRNTWSGEYNLCFECYYEKIKAAKEKTHFVGGKLSHEDNESTWNQLEMEKYEPRKGKARKQLKSASNTVNKTNLRGARLVWYDTSKHKIRKKISIYVVAKNKKGKLKKVSCLKDKNSNTFYVNKNLYDNFSSSLEKMFKEVEMW